MADLIIGFGTGRCGTNSFTQLLGFQGIPATHEIRFLPWKTDKWELYGILLRMLGGAWADEALFPRTFYETWQDVENKRNEGLVFYHIQTMFDRTPGYIADVNLTWLNYIHDAIRIFPDLRAVCLQRNKKDTVKSWMTKDWDLWTVGSKDVKGRPLMPQYELPLKEAIGQYWEDYYAEARLLETFYPENVKIFHSFMLLNEEEPQSEALSFLGIPVGKQVIKTGIQRAKGKYAETERADPPKWKK